MKKINQFRCTTSPTHCLLPASSASPDTPSSMESIPDSQESATRSGRRFSSSTSTTTTSGFKRKHREEEEVGNKKRAAMGNEDGTAPVVPPSLTFEQFTTYLSTTHRAETEKDIQKHVKVMSDRIDTTNAELLNHKIQTQQEIIRIHQCIERISRAPVPQCPLP